jgi:hypothetical protein
MRAAIGGPHAIQGASATCPAASAIARLGASEHRLGPMRVQLLLGSLRFLAGDAATGVAHPRAVGSGLAAYLGGAAGGARGRRTVAILAGLSVGAGRASGGTDLLFAGRIRAPRALVANTESPAADLAPRAIGRVVAEVRAFARLRAPGHPMQPGLCRLRRPPCQRLATRFRPNAAPKRCLGRPPRPPGSVACDPPWAGGSLGGERTRWSVTRRIGG